MPVVLSSDMRQSLSRGPAAAGRDRRLRMAHPFDGHHTGARVEAAGRTWWGDCAWDGYGIAAAPGLPEADITAQGPRRLRRPARPRPAAAQPRGIAGDPARQRP